MSESTIAAISTPQGSGGISIVRMSGDKSFDIIKKIFKPINNRALDKTVKELMSINKPFIILVNSLDPTSNECQALTAEIAAKYNEQQREQRLQQALHGNTDYKGATKSAKRNNLWSKINMGMMIGAGALNTVMPFLFRPWQYNGGNLWDMQGVLFSSMTNLMSSANTIMMAQYANKANQYIQSPQTSGNYKTLNPSNISVQDFMNSVEIYNKQQQEQAEKYKQEKEAAQVKQEAERTAAFAKSIYTKANEEGAVIDDSNKAKLNDIYKTYKKPEEYTQEEKEIMQTIGAYPQIP